MDIIKDIQQIGEGILHAPAWVLLILALNLLGVFLQASPVLPNRFNGWIGFLLLLLGVILTPLVVPTDLFPSSQPHPKLLLGIVGAIFGIVAWLAHGFLFQRIVKRYLPQDDSQTDNNK